jgi:EAL domain-containing protein (putative c-di-GMP-specific phosphodiesterase class I)
MEKLEGLDTSNLPTFGRRKISPRVCVVDSKQHIRTFLMEAFEDLGFITCECTESGDLDDVLENHLPDILVLGLSAGGVAASELLKVLTTKAFSGRVLLVGPRGSRIVDAVRELGDELGIVMLPPLATPFGPEGLRTSMAAFLPVEAPPSPPVDAAEAMRQGWLELWYQPKIDTRSHIVREAEGLIRIRHPTWGIIPPAYFIASDGDPHLRGLSEFVIGRAIEDWLHFFSDHGAVELAVNLPISFLQDIESVESLCRQMPNHPGFGGMIIEINGSEVVRNLEPLKDVAKQLRFHNIAISIDDLGAEWPSFLGIDCFPFVELKVDRKFIAGCANDRLKQSVCRQILDLADSYGARTVAEGVETRADFIAVRDMGFDLVQGFLFAKPMTAKKFALTSLRHPVMLPQ